ncbi:MAG: ROK family protein [Bacteroidales bacterium]|nr:ROK family protein [Bacteroidales bacterium]
MNYHNDKRIVMTLDAGGTNFVFSAIQGLKSIVNPITLPSNADNLDKCLNSIIAGFKEVEKNLKEKPVAISFAFPGPADYPNGIIGDLGNLPAFRGGVALGPMLSKIFGLPVFINNDGDLFAFGEAIAGLLPQVNAMLTQAGSPKQYRNLLGVTLGTGFGAGLVYNKQLYIGDNSAAAEIWLMRNYINNNAFAEESVSIRAVKQVYKQHSKDISDLSPKGIFDIADGKLEGNKIAALKAFEELGTVVGDALANAVTLTDSIIVIGGGLSNAWKYFSPSMFNVLNGKICTLNGDKVDRLEMKAFNLEDKEGKKAMTMGGLTKIKVPFSDKTIDYDPMKRIGIGLSRLGTSQAVSVGAYAFALSKL